MLQRPTPIATAIDDARSALVALTFLFATAGLLAVPSHAAAQSCSGSCALEMSTVTGKRDVERYITAATRDLRRCSTERTATCPCDMNRSERRAEDLSLACTDLLQCRLAQLQAEAVGATWNQATHCFAGLQPGTRCTRVAVSQAAKLASRRLRRERTGKQARNIGETQRCVRRISSACDESTAARICAGAAGIGNVVTHSQACEALADLISTPQVEDAVDTVLNQFADERIPTSPDLLHDPELFVETLLRTGDELACNFDLMADENALPVAEFQSYGKTISLSEPGNCGTGPFTAPRALAGSCLEDVCSAHDQCYISLQRDRYINETPCVFSQLTAECDRDFFNGFVNCLAHNECGPGCVAIATIADRIRSKQFLNLFCYPGNLFDCNGYCQDGLCSSESPTAVSTATATRTPAQPQISTPTRTQPAMATASPTPTRTATRTATPVPTVTSAPTWTRTATRTPTRTYTPLPPSEICNGYDDDGNGIVDDPWNCWRAIYRFQNVAGARCLGTGTTAPSTCSGYSLEIEAFVVAVNPVPGTYRAMQCSKQSDHIVVEYGTSDYTSLRNAGYDCNLQLGYIYRSGQAPWNTLFSRVCDLRRFRYTVSGGLGAHLFTRGPENLTGMTCEAPARGQVLTNSTCFSGTPSGC